MNTSCHKIEPLAAASMVPIIGKVLATVKVTAAPFPTITLDPEPETVHVAFVVAFAKMVYVIPAVVKSAGLSPEPLDKAFQLPKVANEPEL